MAERPQIEAMAWKDDGLALLDQTLLPGATRYLRLERIEGVFEAIQRLRVRGAPAIGISAAYGLYLGVRGQALGSRAEFLAALGVAARHLAGARPTAVNLFWALAAVVADLERSPATDPAELKRELLARAVAIHEDDRRRCLAIAEHGQQVVPARARVLTHCNTGALATGGIGTALGVITHAHALGKEIEVFADETRPLLQGARLTLWELAASQVPAWLICDGMAAALMRQRRIDLVLVGADRIAADGSTANKIGTYGLAIAARHHGVPFYVAAPWSTFDLSLGSGDQIPIETRAEDEVRTVLGQCPIAPPEARCWNPAFDVTPPELITGIITERGLLGAPLGAAIRAAAVACDDRAT